MTRRAGWGPALRRSTQPAGRGQALTELALIVPVLIAILLGIVDFGGAYEMKMQIEAATAQGARIGALEGDGKNVLQCKSSVPTCNVDYDVVSAVLGAPSVDPNSIQQIVVYRAAPDGSIDVSGTTPMSNTYLPPFISGTTLISSSANWPAAIRQNLEPADSIGVRLTYRYRPIVALPGFSAITITDQSIQRLNPPKGEIPCPVPDIPNNVVAQVATAEPPATASDVISWDAVPGATGYNIYTNVNGAGWNAVPVATVATSAGGRISYTYSGNTTYAPAAYEVTGTNYCGEGKRSLPYNNGQCTLPVSPTITTAAFTQTSGMTPTTYYDTLSWTGVSNAASYVITQTAGTTSTTYTAAGSSTGMTVASTSPRPVTYTMSAVTSCGVTGPASPPVNVACTAPGAPTITAVTRTAATTDTVTWTPASSGPAATSWLVSQVITGTSTVTQTVPGSGSSAAFIINQHQPAVYTVQGTSACGAAGPSSAGVGNGRS